MNNVSIKQIIESQTSLYSSMNLVERVNSMFNVLALMNQIGDQDIYKSCKVFIIDYIELIKIGDFGYDNINFDKLETIIDYLPFEKQASISRFALSHFAKELPEYDSGWLKKRFEKAEIHRIVFSLRFKQFPKAILLFSSKNLFTLFATIILFVSIGYLLLPILEKANILSVTMVNYSNGEETNRFLNLCTLMADIDSDIKISPKGVIGVASIIFSKMIFVVLVVNFIYKRTNDILNGN